MRPERSERLCTMPLLGLVLLLAAGCGERSAEEEPVLSLVETMGGADTVGYLRAVEPRPFAFPEDHGPHPGFRTEWWYVTGNVATETGRAFGFQFTLFRSALAPTAKPSSSAWATNQAFMGHLALTDAQSGRFHAFERFARGAGRLAGARATTQGAPDGRPTGFRVWLEDWVLQSDTAARPAGEEWFAHDVGFPMLLRAGEGDVVLDLKLERGKPMVLQGDSGLSQKGTEPGNASYYYSHTRMPAAGALILEGDTLAVSGLAWLDREWSTSALSDGQVGWDWFALQMDDGWDLMIYALRTADGSAHPLSAGVLVDPRGESARLGWGEDVVVEVTETWRSPRGTEYPAAWRVRVPARDWDLEVMPLIPDQELDVTFRYWEGAVRARRFGGDDTVMGRGYVELTGYDATPLPAR